MHSGLLEVAQGEPSLELHRNVETNNTEHTFPTSTMQPAMSVRSVPQNPINGDVAVDAWPYVAFRIWDIAGNTLRTSLLRELQQFRPQRCGRHRSMLQAQATHSIVPYQTVFVFGGPGHGKLAKPGHQKLLEKSLGIKDQSCPMLQLSHKAMW